MVKKANVGPSLSKMSQSWGKCPWLMPTSAREAFCTASQNWSSRRYSSNIHICLSRCWDDDCSPDASLFGICFCAFHGSFRLLRKTDIVSHSMTRTALCWEDGRGDGAKCGSDHAGAETSVGFCTLALFCFADDWIDLHICLGLFCVHTALLFSGSKSLLC